MLQTSIPWQAMARCTDSQGITGPCFFDERERDCTNGINHGGSYAADCEDATCVNDPACAPPPACPGCTR